MKIVVKSEVQEEMTSAFEQNEQMNEVRNYVLNQIRNLNFSSFPFISFLIFIW